MINKEGFYSVEPLNNELTRITLVWNNTVSEGYGNRTESKEIIDVEKFPSFLVGCIGRSDIEETAKQLTKRNNIKECAINFEYFI